MVHAILLMEKFSVSVVATEYVPRSGFQSYSFSDERRLAAVES
jgi:hypothetical protein